MPPFGHATQLRIFIDPDLLQYDGVNDFVWAAVGTWNTELFKSMCSRFLELYG